MRSLFLSIIFIAILLTPTQTYSQCAASGGCDEYISNVVVGSISNNSGSCGNYVDYTGQSTNMTIGTGYSITVTNGNPYSSDQCGIWIDWDQNGVFTDANEVIAITGSPGVGPYTATITPPVGATTGSTTMRVRITYSGAVDPCGTTTYGEVEDYSINVTSPTPMSFVSSAVTQNNTGTVQTCASNQEIIGVEIVTSGSLTPFDLNQMRIRTNGSDDILSDVSNIDVYYTGNSSSFSTGTLFGSATPLAPGTNVNITGTQTLSSGTNYFWIAYDLNAGATVGNRLDALCNRIFMSGVGGTRTPSGTDPAGDRTIVPCVGSPGGISANNTLWIMANDGGNMSYDGSNRVDTWTSSVGSMNVSQSTNADKPIYNAADVHFNYNPYIQMDGTDDVLTNAATGDILGGNGTAIIVSSFVGVTAFAFTGYGNSYQIKTDGNCGHSHSSGNDWQATWASATTVASPSNRPQILGMEGGTTAFNFRNGMYNTTPNSTAFGAIVYGNMNIGSRGGDEFCGAAISEVITYDRALSTTELNYIQSYLAIKYGVTMGANGTSTNYYATDGTIIWDIGARSGYNYDIAGIGTEESTGLYQLKSHSINGGSTATFNDILTVANGTSISVPSSFTDNSSYLVWGNNNGSSTMGAVAAFTSVNGDDFSLILGRKWSSQETNTVTTTSLQFDLSGAGIADLSKVALLVDADGNYSSGATSIAPTSYNNGTGIIEYQHNFVAGTGFHFTLAESVDPIPLAINELIVFEAKLNGSGEVQTNWTEFEDGKSQRFTVERSIDGINFEAVYTVSNEYEFTDEDPLVGISYYRLKYSPNDGTETMRYSTAHKVVVEGIAVLGVYPIPASDKLNVNVVVSKEGSVQISLIDVLGREFLSSTKDAVKGSNRFSIDLRKAAAGTYVLKLMTENGHSMVRKSVVVK